MTPKQRIITAIKHQVPDRIPLAIQEIEDEHKFAAYVGIDNPTEPVCPDIGYYCRSYEMLGIDCFRLEMAYQEQPGTGPDGEGLNEWGAVAKRDYGTDHWYPLGDVGSIQQVENHNWPDPDKFDYAYAAEKASAKDSTSSILSLGSGSLFPTYSIP